GGGSWAVGAGGIDASDPAHLRAHVGGVPITVLRRPLCRLAGPDPLEGAEFLRLFEATRRRFRPDVLVTYGGDRLTREILARSRRAGIATVFALHNFLYTDRTPFAHADAVVVPSRFAADEYARSIGQRCEVLPYPVDPGRVRVARRRPHFLTFVNPCPGKGLYPFARIADELGRLRPDIPVLVVESRGAEADLLACGLDLRRHRTVHVMSQTPDPRAFWSVTRVCLMPSVFRETLGLVAVEAMLNGIPVVASDRGALPETLGRSGVLLPLPDHLTPESRHLPTAEEIAPWVEAIVRLWDTAASDEGHRQRALAEARRWAPEALEPRYARFFAGLRPGSGPEAAVHGEAETGP
ncbi:MAG TPA: glycosyltransferase, partial [Isosphaeraceae bacterium]|nr:glycosyltransferase [Isosphaeraceae bacterium]